jgi:hypothetical protein
MAAAWALNFDRMESASTIRRLALHGAHSHQEHTIASTPSGCLVVLEKPNRSSITFAYRTLRACQHNREALAQAGFNSPLPVQLRDHIVGAQQQAVVDVGEGKTEASGALRVGGLQGRGPSWVPMALSHTTPYSNAHVHIRHQRAGPHVQA